MIILSNDDVEGLVTAAECIQVLDDAYRDLASNEAGNIPRADLIAPIPGGPAGAHYGFKTMSGGFPRRGVTALRINSDVVTWPEQGGSLRRVKLPVAGGRYVGLVLLFSNSTGEPLAIMPDGIMQRLRVGSTSALAARYLARDDSATMALIGSGGQARGQALAFATRPGLKRIRVFSPNQEKCRTFVAALQPLLTCELELAGTVEAAIEGADIVSCATNSLEAVFNAEWVKPGMHLTCVKRTEIAPQAFLRCDVLFQHYRKELDQYILGGSRVPDEESVRAAPSGHRVEWSKTPEMEALVSGTVAGRTRQDQVTAFCNNIGMGLQFAAVGALAYEKARQRGVGRELPTEWFTEDIRP
jgi:alanine dehydrogenase